MGVKNHSWMFLLGTETALSVEFFL